MSIFRFFVDRDGVKVYTYGSIADIAGGKRCDGEIQLCATFSGVLGVRFGCAESVP